MACLLIAGSVWAVATGFSRAARRFILIVVVAYSAVSMYPISHAAAALLFRSYRPLTAADVPAGHNAMVILASGSFTAHDWDENKIFLSDPASADRVVEAVRVYKLTHPDIIVSSGGSVGGMDHLGPGGTVMRDLLVQLGVPASRILVETDSKTTHDEAVIVKQMLAPLKVDHIVLVTSDVHMWRSVGTFRAAGLDVIPAIARTAHVGPAWNISFLPSPTGINEFQDFAHEVGGVAYYSLRGWYKK
jgi:uncharacterized SAM-binding protein YcdF (DUF218 family)